MGCRDMQNPVSSYLRFVSLSSNSMTDLIYYFSLHLLSAIEGAGDVDTKVRNEIEGHRKVDHRAANCKWDAARLQIA